MFGGIAVAKESNAAPVHRSSIFKASNDLLSQIRYNRKTPEKRLRFNLYPLGQLCCFRRGFRIGLVTAGAVGIWKCLRLAARLWSRPWPLAWRRDDFVRHSFPRQEFTFCRHCWWVKQTNFCELWNWMATSLTTVSPDAHSLLQIPSQALPQALCFLLFFVARRRPNGGRLLCSITLKSALFAGYDNVERV